MNLAILKEEIWLEIDYQVIGANVKKIRNEKGLTQDELAEKCNLSSVYIGYIENGKRQVGLATLANIANVLDIGLDYLVGNQKFILSNKLIEDCNEYQKQIIYAIVKSVKEVLLENEL